MGLELASRNPEPMHLSSAFLFALPPYTQSCACWCIMKWPGCALGFQKNQPCCQASIRVTVRRLHTRMRGAWHNSVQAMGLGQHSCRCCLPRGLYIALWMRRALGGWKANEESPHTSCHVKLSRAVPGGLALWLEHQPID